MRNPIMVDSVTPASVGYAVTINLGLFTGWAWWNTMALIAGIILMPFIIFGDRMLQEARP